MKAHMIRTLSLSFFILPDPNTLQKSEQGQVAGTHGRGAPLRSAPFFLGTAGLFLYQDRRLYQKSSLTLQNCPFAGLWGHP